MILAIISRFKHVINTHVISYMFADSLINIGFFEQTPLARYLLFKPRLNVMPPQENN